MKKTLIALLSIISIHSASAQIDLKKGLVLYLPFDGDTKDASPYGNDAVNHGAKLAPDQYGKVNSAYQFDGSSWMEVPHSSSVGVSGTALTISARVKPLAFYDGDCHANIIMAKGTDRIDGNYTLWYTPTYNSDCSKADTAHMVYSAFYANNGPSYATIANPPYIRTNQWDCIVYTTDGVTGNMYVNGDLRYTHSVTGSIGSNTNPLYLGRIMEPLYPYWFTGVMDEIRVYNRSLTTPELDSLCKYKPIPSSILEEHPTKLSIVTNPVRNEMVLGLEQHNLGGHLTIISSDGSKVLTIQSLDKTTVDVSSIIPGMYFVEYRNENFVLRNKILKID